MKKENRSGSPSKKKKARSPRRSEASSLKKIITSSVFGSVISGVIMLSMLIILSAVCLLLPSPHSLISPLSFFIMYSSAFLGGFTAVKKNNRADALLCSGLCGVIFMIAIWLVFSLVGMMLGVSDSSPYTFLWRLLIIPLSCVGGFIGMSGASDAEKKRRARKRG